MNGTVPQQDWLYSFLGNHHQLMQYVDGLIEDELLYSDSGRWDAGRQLQHVYLCLVAVS